MKSKKIIAVILIICICIGLYSCSTNKKTPSESQTKIDVEKIAYDYKEDEKFDDMLKTFSLNSASTIFADGLNQNKNLCYSPVSLYIAFALAASGAENQTQSEMFAVLGLNGKDKQYISQQINVLFGNLYFENKYGALKIANSIWLKENADIKKEFNDNAENHFYSQVFNADFSDMPKTPDMMKKWVEDNTNKLISPSFDYDPDQIFMYIINTLYFKDSWKEPFDERSTKTDLFYVPNDENIECEFMNKGILSHPYFKGDGFTAASLDLYNGGKMTFVLPDENTDIYDLLSSPGKLDYIFNDENSKIGDVTFKVPKFKTEASFDLINALKNLGVQKAFSTKEADFSGITDEPIYISKITQDTYIKIDEKGVEAAAMTQIMMYAGGIPEPNEKIDMFLDRPFVYFITDKNGVVLFEGVIFNPNA